MRYWQFFESSHQLLLSNLLYDTREKILKRESVKCHERLFEDFVCRIIQPDIFLEIGAHEASTSSKFKGRLPHCSVHAFEADPEVFLHFREKVSSDINYINSAVSRHDGYLNFFRQQKDDERLFLNNSLFKKDSVNYDEHRVKSVTVDSFLEEVGLSSTVLRIDAEGNTYEVIMGAAKSMSFVKAIYAEVEDYEIWEGQRTVFDVHDALEDYGFFPVSRDVETPGQYNVIWLRQDLAFQRQFRSRLLLYFNELKELDRRAGGAK